MNMPVSYEDKPDLPTRSELELDTIRARDEGHTTIESWLEKEKQRLWLGYFSIKI